jgi:hypothetical protein
MRRSRLASVAAGAAGLLLMTGVVVGTGGVSAQDMAEASHPAHLHVGDCSAPGEVVFPLTDVSGSFGMDGTPMAGMDWVGQESAIPVEASASTVQASLADIVAGGHSIVVHESMDNIGNYIACGAVGGYMLGASDLPVGLGELNDSGESGVAWLHDNGDGTTTVYLFLTNDDEMMGDDMGGDDMMATPSS